MRHSVKISVNKKLYSFGILRLLYLDTCGMLLAFRFKNGINLCLKYAGHQKPAHVSKISRLKIAGTC